ncbi:MAG: cysteine hydrolase [Elusimicrobiaceae bacterium]|jgi:nicotinamidase-related amidase|nr:cysteine hydrolase [Elusimicrobiaceae bacterium]MBT3954809.1 cysteine hydrolase [Elusimicrobiaceae bacterium]MBT4008803.1 cysteine hydrolase [Elusimicrobiaceae bacterium]MBT4402253.1 cysteine hydrolase [Elusimicrobiaceae bacterium]MBT4440290.1 cysteine hydrolase [Elusimicrobiaceae bacterium]
MRKFKLNIKKSALIVIDMQNFFCDPKSHAYISGTKKISKNINKLIEIYKKNNRPIIFTSHKNTKQNAQILGLWWKDVITSKYNAEICKEFDTKNHKIISKTQYDCFYKTKLDEILKKHKIKHLLITGVATHLCVETTTRSAFVRGYLPFVPINCTADFSPKFYKSTLLNLADGFAVIDTWEKLLNEK